MSDFVHKEVNFEQTVAILLDGNNIERGIKSEYRNDNMVINFDNFIPKLLRGRKLTRVIYFREGRGISPKLSERLDNRFFGTTVSCIKSADVPLTINAVQLAEKVNTVIIGSGDVDYLELVRFLKGKGVRVELAVVRNCLSAELAKVVDGIYYVETSDVFDLSSVKK